ncbi:hypothetical protein [Streptomyces sp. NPDC051567]|uniref:hypothetical protein n=1 Tax=Streptomyces sp. NPDC051567 TaxID=3365660 RepID=UPI003794FAA5
MRPATGPHDDPAGDVVRWAAFSCLLVPVVLVVYGTSFGGAAVATLGLLAVTAACRAMLRHAERAQRAAAREPARAVPRGRHAHGGTHDGTHGGSGRHRGPGPRGPATDCGAGTHRGCHRSGPAPSHD